MLWLPFLLKVNSWLGLNLGTAGFEYIYKNYDGPLYVIVAKTFYAHDTPYFAAHLPLYPALIFVFKQIIGVFVKQLAYLKSMLLVNILSTIGLAGFFYYLVKKFRLTNHPMFLTATLLFLPRFLVVRVVGAPESLFMLLTLLSVYFFEKDKYFWAGIFGGLSVMVKSPGILLFGAYGLVFLERLFYKKRIELKWFWTLLIPFGLLTVFLIYWRQMGDFLAYFHSGDNIHLMFPFAVFNYQKTWVGTAWLEDVVFYYLLYGVAVVTLWKSKYRSFFYYSLVFFVATLFVQHRDISRYSLPIWPFAAIAFEKFLTDKKYRLIFFIILVGIYFYAWNFLSYNVMPIADWKPFL